MLLLVEFKIRMLACNEVGNKKCETFFALLYIKCIQTLGI